MDEQQRLHLRRLQECFSQIEELRAGNALHPDFQRWKDRTGRELGALFEANHDYTWAFKSLDFCEARVVPYPAEMVWTAQDKLRFEIDLKKAEEILRDALEEFETAPDAFPAVKPFTEPTTTAPSSGTGVNVQLIVQQLQSVSQIQSVSYEQVIESIPSLDLEPEVAAEASELAEQFKKEAEGGGSWDRIGKIVGNLRALGKGVFEKVAAPLLVEYIKRETGL